jgi:hypothetical protein
MPALGAARQLQTQQVQTMTAARVIGYAFGAALVATLTVLLIGLATFGANVNEWAEWQGGIVGVAGTIAGVAAAALGLRRASRAERHRSKVALCG